ALRIPAAAIDPLVVMFFLDRYPSFPPWPLTEGAIRVRITRVEPIPMLVRLPAGTQPPISVPYAEHTAATIFKGYRTCLVRVYTDEGMTGIGECMTRLAPQATAAIVSEIGEVLGGIDPVETSVAWELMFALMMNRGHLKGFFMEAISGIDVALWDLKGKILN